MELTINIRLTADKGFTETLTSLTSTLAALESRPVVAPTPRPAAIEPLPFDAPKGEPKAPKIEAKLEASIGEKEIRMAMQSVREKFEYPDGDLTADPDPKIHKALTQIYKDLAERIDKGTKPTRLTGVYAEEFIRACEGIIMVDGMPCHFSEEGEA